MRPTHFQSLFLGSATIAAQPQGISAFQFQFHLQGSPDTRRTKIYNSKTSSRCLLQASSSSYDINDNNILVDVDENSPRDPNSLISMQEWAMACGVQQMQGLELTYSQADDPTGGLDFTLRTTVDIPANTPILFVPNGPILSSQEAYQQVGDGGSARQVNARVLLERFGKGSDQHFPQLCLFVKMLMEYEKGTQSPWFPWLDSLPRRYSNGASMTPFCFRCLPPLVAKLAKDERTRFVHFQQTLRQMYKNLVSQETIENIDLQRWAYSIVYTRGFFRTEEDFVIAPMADYINHGTWPNVATHYDEEGNCNVYATTDIPAGSELLQSYGDPTNPSFLLARYGFLDETSPATFCKFMIENPTPELQAVGYHPSRMLFYKDTGAVSEEVWDVLLYQRILKYDDPNVRQQFYEAHVNGDVQTKQSIHEHYYSQTHAALLDHVESFLDDLDYKAEIVKRRNVKEHPRIPLIVKHNEYVRDTFLTVKQALEQQ